MSQKPRALDLFSGAGGMTHGLQMAGFHVTGVDVAPQPHYVGDAFFQADALTFPLEGYDVIHASPPCQAFTANRVLLNHRAHADLLTPIRERLQSWGGTWVIENVPRAPMRRDVVLCGSMFGLPIFRHRWFEFSEPRLALTLECRHDFAPLDVTGTGGPGGRHRKPASLQQARDALGIDWMTRRELSQAIPPAYGFFIGTRLREALQAAA